MRISIQNKKFLFPRDRYWLLVKGTTAFEKQKSPHSSANQKEVLSDFLKSKSRTKHMKIFTKCSIYYQNEDFLSNEVMCIPASSVTHIHTDRNIEDEKQSR